MITWIAMTNNPTRINLLNSGIHLTRTHGGLVRSICSSGNDLNIITMSLPRIYLGFSSIFCNHHTISMIHDKWMYMHDHDNRESFTTTICVFLSNNALRPLTSSNKQIPFFLAEAKVSIAGIKEMHVSYKRVVAKITKKLHYRHYNKDKELTKFKRLSREYIADK